MPQPTHTSPSVTLPTLDTQTGAAHSGAAPPLLAWAPGQPPPSPQASPQAGDSPTRTAGRSPGTPSLAQTGSWRAGNPLHPCVAWGRWFPLSGTLKGTPLRRAKATTRRSPTPTPSSAPTAPSTWTEAAAPEGMGLLVPSSGPTAPGTSMVVCCPMAGQGTSKSVLWGTDTDPPPCPQSLDAPPPASAPLSCHITKCFAIQIFSQNPP
mmetsp:Transcript_92991/g.161165  ORF Transcript_92991/g.161165 Transcript_92991/m.161165 type:complete len:208 (-) Transcript_92991:2431-3054(-)